MRMESCVVESSRSQSPFQALLQPLRSASDRLMVSSATSQYTGDAFVQAVERLGAWMASQPNWQPGQRVGILFHNQPEFLVALFATRLAGGVAVPFNITLSPDDLLYVMRHSDIALLVASAELTTQMAHRIGVELHQLPVPAVLQGLPEPAVAEPAGGERLWRLESVVQEPPLQAPPEGFPYSPAQPDELALLMYTSGTTGNPKGVMLSEANLAANMEGFSRQLALPAGQRMLLGLPLFHSYGLICALYAFQLQAPLWLVPKFQPKSLLDILVRERITILPLVPTLFHVLVQQADGLPVGGFSDLQVCISGGAALPSSLLARAESLLGAPILEGYGMTETSPVIAVNTLTRGSAPGRVGKTLANVQLRLVDAQGEVVAWMPGQASAVGEVQVQGPSVTRGYYRNEEETRCSFTPDGWLRTGDLGFVDEEGLLAITGRIKELIIKAGENISPAPIEHCLAQHPAVEQVAVVGRADEKLGERIVAYFTTFDQQPASAQVLTELRQLARQQLSALQQPDAYSWLEAMPLTPTGKIMKKRLPI